MAIAPVVRARLIERLLFNFRVSPDALRRHLPVPWLEPQILNGYSVVSLCILRLSNITLVPLPGIAPISSICWAYRYGVIDSSVPGGRPSVYVQERLSDSFVVNRGGPRLLRVPFPRTQVSYTSYDGVTTNLYTTRPDGCPAFVATVTAATNSRSRLFGTVGALQRFIREGVSSYTLSSRDNRLVRIDLHKEEMQYEPLNVRFCYATILDEWKEESLIFDSAFRTRGGNYEWRYRYEVPTGAPGSRFSRVAA